MNVMDSEKIKHGGRYLYNYRGKALTISELSEHEDCRVEKLVLTRRLERYFDKKFKSRFKTMYDVLNQKTVTIKKIKQSEYRLSTKNNKFKKNEFEKMMDYFKIGSLHKESKIINCKEYK